MHQITKSSPQGFMSASGTYIKSQFLINKTGSSDKLYLVFMYSYKGTYIAAAAYGRNGKILTYFAIHTSVSYSETENVFNNAIAAKRKRGYRDLNVPERLTFNAQYSLGDWKKHFIVLSSGPRKSVSPPTVTHVNSRGEERDETYMTFDEMVKLGEKKGKKK